MSSVARLLVLLPLLWVLGGLCASAHGAEQIDQIILLRSGSNAAVNALRESDSNNLRAKAGDTLVLRRAVAGSYEITIDKARRSSLGNTIIHGTTASGGRSLMVLGAGDEVGGYFELSEEVFQVSTSRDGTVTASVGRPERSKRTSENDVIYPSDDSSRFSAPHLEGSAGITSISASTASADVSYARFRTGHAKIRILIYYRIGSNAISTMADFQVELTNMALARSGVSASLEIAAIQPVELGSDLRSLDIIELMMARAPPFETIDQDLFDANAGLAITLAGEPSGFLWWHRGGRAELGGRFRIERFSVVEYDSRYDFLPEFADGSAFPHEIGHNLGALHNREDDVFQDLSLASAVFSYAWGYSWGYEGIRTIMGAELSTEGTEQIRYFSNPEVMYSCTKHDYPPYDCPIGVPATSEDSAFVARVFENNRFVAGADRGFSYENVLYFSSAGASSLCDELRVMKLRNNTDATLMMESHNYVLADGSVESFGWTEDRYVSSSGDVVEDFCLDAPEQNPLGTTYVESFFRYYHPTTGALVEGPRYRWGQEYSAHSELRIAHTYGGTVVGNTHRLTSVGDQEEVAFLADRGFVLDKVATTCEGSRIGKGFLVTATSDGCLVEGSFMGVADTPSGVVITASAYEDGEISLWVTVGNDGGADIIEYEATCTNGTEIYSATSASSVITVSGLRNDVPYICSVTVTNSNGLTSDPSQDADPITPEGPFKGLPVWLLYEATK